MPEFDMIRPCTNCPFRTDETAIRFATREVAAEIEESAYRNGFPCHVTAEHREADQYGYRPAGFYFGRDTQHCVGYIILQLKSGHGIPWPGINNDEALVEELAQRVDWDAPVFDDVDEFLDANPR